MRTVGYHVCNPRFKGPCEFREGNTRRCRWEGTCNQKMLNCLVDDTTKPYPLILYRKGG